MKIDLNNNTNNKTNSNYINNTKNTIDANNWNSKYQLYLDNIVIQLLNALKIQENIFIEYSKLEKNKNIKPNQSNNHLIKHSNSNSYFREQQHHNTGFCTTSNSWTFNNGKSYNQNTDFLDDIDSYIENDLDNYPINEVNDNSFNKFQHLLIQQQRQQINILNDLTQLSKSLKTLNMTNNSQKPCSTSTPTPPEEQVQQSQQQVSAKQVPNTPVHQPKQKSSLVIKVTGASDQSKYHSQCKQQSKSSPPNNKANQPKISNNNNKPNAMSNNENGNINSKIPKFSTNKNNSNTSLTNNSNNIVANKRQQINEKKKQIKSNNANSINNRSASSVTANNKINPVLPKNTRVQSSSKIPQPRGSASTRVSKEDNSSNLSNKSSDQDVSLSTKYNTYIKNNNKKKTNDCKKIIINSNTFDKNESSNSNNSSQQAPIDILLVPVKTENNKVVINTSIINPSVISNTKRTKEDEGYSTMSNELMNQIKVINPAVTNSISEVTKTTTTGNTATGNDTDSGITRVSQISGSDSSSTPSSSLNHSPISQQQPTLKIINPNFQLNQKPQPTQKSSAPPRKTKRYCFPTLKSFSYYYNNRYYHQYHKSQNEQQACCKYLSDTDITSLVNQLSSYDKDLSFNVFHLDTLYNNVDYILFNSYASDTELAYNYNRRHGRNQHFLNSNYKLYINDYFNQPYDGEEVDLDSNNSSNNNNQIEDEVIIPNDQLPTIPTPPSQQQEKIIDYELKGVDKYEFELDDEEEQEIEIDYPVDQDDYYYFNLYNNEYIDYENVMVTDDDNKMIELTVDENLNNVYQDDDDDDNEEDYYHNNNLIFDDDDLLMMISSNPKKKHKKKHSKNNKNSKNSPLLFSSDSILSDSSSLSSSGSEASFTTTSASSSSISCSCPSSNNSSNEDDSNMSIDSINNKNNQKNKTCKHGRRHHKRHDYFIDRIDKYCERYEKYTRNHNNFSNTNNSNDTDLDDFVRQLNLQCNLDKTLQTSKNTSQRLKELNMMAINAVVNAAASSTTNNNTNSFNNERVVIISRPPLVRRHTITSMPLNSACINNQKVQPGSPQINNCDRNKISTIMTNQSPSKFTNSKDYVGSFNKNNKTNSLDYRNNRMMINSNTDNSIANSCGSYNQSKPHKRRNTISNNINNANNIIDFSGMGSPIRVNNDFNTDFYRLCSDSFFNNGSDMNLNLNRSESSSSVSNQNHQQLKEKPLETIIDNSSSSSQNLNVIGKNNNVAYETNLASHVNSLFDHWLHQNSSILSLPPNATANYVD